jgi:hypothetical protein
VCTKLELAGLVCLISWVTNAQADNMAISCEFSLMKQAHESLVFCGEPIDPASEARYEKLSQDFSTFIAKNGNPADYSGSLEQIRRRLQQDGRDRVCKDPDYPFLRRAFFRYVSDAGMTSVNDLLSRHRDPSEGDCF